MLDLRHERELARLEQERLERLRAEELLFQQVRQGRAPEAMELAVSASAWCDPNAERLPVCGYFHMVFLYLHLCMHCLHWRCSSEAGGKLRERALRKA